VTSSWSFIRQLNPMVCFDQMMTLQHWKVR